MVTRQLQLTFSFEETVEFPDEPAQLELKSISRSTDLTAAQIESLGDSVAQTDRWQVEIWAKIQELLGDSDTSSVAIR